MITDIWADTFAAPDKSYVVQTAESVIQRCILMTTDPGDLVLDPTCESGTTAYVAEQRERRWITTYKQPCDGRHVRNDQHYCLRAHVRPPGGLDRLRSKRARTFPRSEPRPEVRVPFCRRPWLVQLRYGVMPAEWHVDGLRANGAVNAQRWAKRAASCSRYATIHPSMAVHEVGRNKNARTGLPRASTFGD